MDAIQEKNPKDLLSTGLSLYCKYHGAVTGRLPDPREQCPASSPDSEVQPLGAQPRPVSLWP